MGKWTREDLRRKALHALRARDEQGIGWDMLLLSMGIQTRLPRHEIERRIEELASAD